MIISEYETCVFFVYKWYFAQRTQLLLYCFCFCYGVVIHDDVIKWKPFLRYWLFVRGIRLSLVNSPHKGQWHGALMFSLICAWINSWVNNREAGDLRRRLAHYDVIVIYVCLSMQQTFAVGNTTEKHAEILESGENPYMHSIFLRHLSQTDQLFVLAVVDPKVGESVQGVACFV